jgi:riboflavin biosynthesis pyrimidine reductase
MAEQATLLRLYPAPAESVPLPGLYLSAPWGIPAEAGKGFVYTNYIASLDGRIAVQEDSGEGTRIPAPIENPRDFRLYQELAAQADAVVVSGQYARDLAAGTAQAEIPLSTDQAFDDLHAWRKDQGRSPQPTAVLVSRRLDFPIERIRARQQRNVIVATAARADDKAVARLESEGAVVLAAGGERVEGPALLAALGRLGLDRIYVAGGPRILSLFATTGRLDRIYLSLHLQLLGGERFRTLLEGPRLDPALGLALVALHLDTHPDAGPGQLFGLFEPLPGNC